MPAASAISRHEAKQIVLEDEIANGVYAAHYSERRFARIALGALALTSVALTGALVLLASRPTVNRYVRIDEMGRAQAIQYSDLRYIPSDGEVRTQITTWAGYRYAINPGTITRDYGRNFYFLSRPLASQLMAEDTENHLYSRVKNSQLEPNEVDIRDVTLASKTAETIGNITTVKGTALMTFDKVYAARTSREPRTEHWIASLTYYMNPAQVNDQSRTNPQYGLINPLGLTITEIHENLVSVDQELPGAPVAEAGKR
jgi:type IV secretion system protein VirB5